jgi:integrase
VYRYHRATGIRLPDDLPENHPYFLAAWLAAENGLPTPNGGDRSATHRAGTVAHAWWQFCKSDPFMDLSKGYRRRMAAHGDQIVAKAGSVPINQIRAYHIENDIAELERNAARKRLKTWRKFMDWSTPRLTERNWAQQVDMPKAAKSVRHARWSADDIAIFRKRWQVDTPQRLAFELLLFTGMRLSDAVRAGPGWVDRDGWLSFTQQKTGGAVLVAFDRDLPDMANQEAHSFLSACLDAQDSRHMTWMTTAYGAARSEKAASNWFSAACRSAGLKNDRRRTAHGLRDTCCANLAESGATAHQIMTWSGHESLSEVERYTKDVERKAILTPNDPRTQIVQVRKS